MSEFIQAFIVGYELGNKIRQRKAMKEIAAEFAKQEGLSDQEAAMFLEASSFDNFADAMVNRFFGTPSEGTTGGGGTDVLSGGSAGSDTLGAPAEGAVWGDPVQRAFLDTIASRESSGRYDVRYDGSATGATFDINNPHPRIYAPGPDGPSSAAGRYQFIGSTWDEIAGAGTPMTRENQDRAAWDLAVQRYGPTLYDDLKNGGFNTNIVNKLSPTWAALKGNADWNGTYASRLAALTDVGLPVREAADDRLTGGF